MEQTFGANIFQLSSLCFLTGSQFHTSNFLSFIICISSAIRMQIWTKSSSSTVFNGKWFVLRYCNLFLPDWSKLLVWHLDLSLVSQKIQRWWLNSRKRLRNIRILWLLTLKKNIQNCLTKRTVSIWIPFLCYLIEVAQKVTRWCFFFPPFVG